MTTTLPEIEELRPRPADVANLGADLRGVAASLQDVQEWADRASGTAGWSGEAAQAAGQARARFAGRTAEAAAALELAALATTRFEDRLSVLHDRRTRLERERIEAAAEDAERLRAEIAAWRHDVAEAQLTFTAALRSIETGAPVGAAEHAAPPPDTAPLLRHLTALAGSPGAVAAWWRTLSLAQRQALIVADPATVGRTDGIPVTGRDRANRAALDARRGLLLERQADGPLTAAETAELANLDALQRAVDAHRHDVDPVTGRGLFHVIAFDPAAFGGDGTSVVSLGNPDHAAHVATYTPGFTTDGGRLDDLGRVEDLRREMLHHSRSVATVLYEDYDAPSLDEIKGVTSLLNPIATGHALRDGIGVAGTADAQAGGHRLAGFLAGLEVTRQHRDAGVTVIGHSYGSVLAAYAARDASPLGTRGVDSVVLLADPGAPGHDVHDLVGDCGIRVFVGADDHDPVSLIGSGPHGGPGTLGADPAVTTYGAQRIGEWTGPESGKGVLGFANHGSAAYLGAGTEGLRNVGAIATGHQPGVVPGRDATSYESLTTLLEHAGVHATPGMLERVAGGGSWWALRTLLAGG